MRHSILAPLLLLSAGINTGKPWKDSTLHKILLPTAAPPSDPEDEISCFFSNVSQYLDPPRPTGDLLDAMYDYGEGIISACLKERDTVDVDGCWPDIDQWCAFTTKAPASVTSDLNDWGSSATSWWAAASSDAVDAASECPQNWFGAMIELARNRQWLNLTLQWSACDEEDKDPDLKTTITTAFEDVTAAPGSTQANTKATATNVPNRAATYRADDAWKAAGGGVAAAVANMAL